MPITRLGSTINSIEAGPDCGSGCILTGTVNDRPPPNDRTWLSCSWDIVSSRYFAIGRG